VAKFGNSLDRVGPPDESEAIAAGCRLLSVGAWPPLFLGAFGVRFAGESESGFPAGLKGGGLNGACTTDAPTPAPIPASIPPGNGSEGEGEGEGEGKVEATGAGPSAGNESGSEFLLSSEIGPIASEPVELGGTWTEPADAGACPGDISAGDVLAAVGRSGGSTVTGASAGRDSGADEVEGRSAGSGLEAIVYGAGSVAGSGTFSATGGRPEVTAGADGNGRVTVPPATRCCSLSVPFALSGCSGMLTASVGAWAVGAAEATSGLAILATGGCLPEGVGFFHFWTTKAVTRIKNESIAAVPIRASRLNRSHAPADRRDGLWFWPCGGSSSGGAAPGALPLPAD